MRMSRFHGFVAVLTVCFLHFAIGEQAAHAQLASPLTSATGYADSFTHSYNLSKIGSPSVTSIVGTGSRVEPGDDGQVDASIGFDFNFFGTDYSDLQVEGNGHVYLGTGYDAGDNYINGAAGNGAHPENNGGSIHTNYSGPRIDFWWDDLNSNPDEDPPVDRGAIYTETRGSAGSREFVVEYDGVPAFFGGAIADDTTYKTSVQMVLHEETNDITFNYIDFVPGTARNGLAIGIQANEFAYLQYGWFSASRVELPTGVGIPSPGESLLWQPTSLALPTLLEVLVDRVTGVVRLANNSGAPIDIKGYSITSPDGALNAPNAAFLADSDSNWVRLSAADGNDLSEAHLTTDTIAAGATMVFGNETWLQYYKENVQFKFLDGQGRTIPAPVTFSGDAGAGEVPFPFIDLNFDTQVDIQDWVTFKANGGNDLTGMSVVELYRNSDLDGNGRFGVSDFLIFKKEFDRVNGTGAFAAIASVPEPAALTLISLCCVVVIGVRHKRLRRKNLMNSLTVAARSVRSRAVGALIGMIGCLLLPVASRAAIQIWSEDFEGLTLIDSVIVTERDPITDEVITFATDGDDETDWNTIAASGLIGWTMDPRTTPVATIPNFGPDPDNPDDQETGYAGEYYGWTVVDHSFWLNEQGNQAGRNEFLPSLQPNNTMLVVEPDGHDDFVNLSDTNFSTVVKSPLIDISSVVPGTLDVSFFSTWVPEDKQQAAFRVTYDTTGTTEIFLWDSEDTENFKEAGTNENVRVSINNPAGASTVQLEWDMPQAGNDWWWGIDNINLESVGPPLELIVDKATGEMSLNSDILPSNLNSYSITSAAGALNPAGWKAGNYASQATGGGLSADLNADGKVDGADFILGQQQGADASFYADFSQQFGQTGGSSPGVQWEVLNDSQNQLFEALLTGDEKLIEALTGQSIGSGYDTANGAEDLLFSYSTSGQEIEGKVSYTNGSLAATAAVPEPSSLALILLATVFAVAVGRRKNFHSLLGESVMNNRVENVCGKCWTTAVCALLGLAWFASAAQANFTVDRDYRLGDDSGENATAGAIIPGNKGSFDSFTPFVDLQASSGNPVYATITGRPDGGSGLGVAFDGSLSQFLRGFRLGDPGTSKSSNINVGGTIDYFDTRDRGMQFWAKPGSAPGAQTLVMDTNQHGVRINEKGFYSMRYNGLDFDTDVPASADVWRQIMVVADAGGARMYIDGVGEAAAPGGYDISDMANLVLGANTAGGESLGSFTGGTEEFYTGILDDLELFVMGPNETGSVDFGTFNFKTDNDFAVFAGFPANPVDINGDGTVSGDGTGPAATDDVTAFVDGWLFENVHNGVRFGDLDTIRSGDINVDGIVDLDDWSLLNAASPALGAAILQSLAAVPEPGSCLLMVVAGLLGLPALGRKVRRG